MPLFDDDEVDGAGGTNRKLAASRIATYVGASAGAFSIDNLDIDGGTDIGAAIVDADLFIVDDGAGGTNRKVTASRIKTYVGGVALANDANNRVVTADGSDGLNGEANLTFDGEKLLLETYLFDFSKDIYGKDIVVSFIEFIRKEKKFDGIDLLKEQIALDSKKAIKILDK